MVHLRAFDLEPDWCRAEGDSSDFAARLSVWQKENGVQPTGVLDSNTWSRMALALQSRRMIGRGYPASRGAARVTRSVQRPVEREAVIIIV
jgi:hypothetical protein